MGRSMGRFVLLLGFTLSAAACTTSAQRQAVPVVVYKDAACGCCSQWVTHLEAAGFSVSSVNVDDLDAVKSKHGIPRRAQSCHTATVEGYVVEGHVPASDIQRLLKERPAIAGLAVPAMPVGSPGMEVPGIKPQPYDVLALHRDGRLDVYASYNK